MARISSIFSTTCGWAVSTRAGLRMVRRRMRRTPARPRVSTRAGLRAGALDGRQWLREAIETGPDDDGSVAQPRRARSVYSERLPARRYLKAGGSPAA